MQNIFSADITVVDDADDGIHIECVEPHLSPVSRALTEAGFGLDIARVTVQGTSNLPNIMELPVKGGTFDEIKMTVKECLIKAGVTVTEENFSGLGELRVRFNLENVSVFGN